MAKKIAGNAAPLLINIIMNVLTIFIAMAIVNYMNDIRANPQCRELHPTTRQGLTIYAYLVMVLSGISLIMMAYLMLVNMM